MEFKQFEAAFPYPTGNATHHPGMDLRDWFAGQAIAGLVQQLDIGRHPAEVYGEPDARDTTTPLENLVILAYWIADGMLEVRTKATPETDTEQETR